MYKYFHDIIFTIQNSKFDFFINGTKIDETNCKLADFNQSTNIFGQIRILEMLSDVYYSKQTCPFVFLNTKLDHLKFGQITNSLILKNQLGFMDINQTTEFDLNNKNLYFLSLYIAFEDLTSRLIDKYVFKYILMYIFIRKNIDILNKIIDYILRCLISIIVCNRSI
jgi:hypothetical protein